MLRPELTDGFIDPDHPDAHTHVPDGFAERMAATVRLAEFFRRAADAKPIALDSLREKIPENKTYEKEF